MEVIKMTKQLYKELESFQNRIMRYALNAHAATSIHVMRRELGWWSMKGRVYMRKLSFYGTLVNLPYARWARAALEENMWIGGGWYEEILDICKELQLKKSPWMMASSKEWKSYARKAIMIWEHTNNSKEIANRSSLVCYPADSRYKGKGYLLEKGATEICKFRTNQILYEAKAAGETECILCNNSGLGAKHYLLYCGIVEQCDLKQTKGLRTRLKARRGLIDDELTREMLARPDVIGQDLVTIYRKLQLKRIALKKKKSGVG